MNTVVRVEVQIQDIRVTEDTITAYLTDGRTISVALAWSWRLSEATPEQRANFEIIGDGEGVHWPDIDLSQNIARLSLLHPEQAIAFKKEVIEVKCDAGL